MKRMTTKEILSESFRELAKTRSIDRITIQDIVDNCSYSPATFYRHFKDKYDLIAWDYTQQLAKIMGRIDEKEYTWKQTLLDGAKRFQVEKDYLTNLFLHTSGHDSFIQYMAEINYEALEKHFLALNGQQELDEKTAMLIRTYCHGTVCLTCEWILGRYTVTPDELAEIYEDALPIPLRAKLLKEQ